MSNFGIRGFIEGFYGRVWSDGKRRRVLKLAAEHGMNAYFYSPKDDPYLRQRWRDSYDEASLDRFSSLLRYTQDLGMSLYYCLSPGLDTVYSSDGDFEILQKKFGSVYSLGVRNFGLFLDDIPDRLTDEKDINKFADVCEAHVFLINRLYEAMPSDCTLTVCPMQYHGQGSEPYITKLCHSIPEEVKVFWTGKKICSPEITSEDALKFIEYTGRKPLYWDNFPVNDAEMYGEMHIGPYLGRSPDLDRYSEGIVCNMMEYALCSAIPLLTVCDYLSDASDYEPEKSFADAVEAVTGCGYGSWMPFLDHTRYSCLCDCFSEYLSDTLAEVKAEYFAGRTEKAAEMTAGLINEYRECSQTVKSCTELYEELEKWVKRFDEITEILVLARAFIISESSEDREALISSTVSYNASAYKLAGFGLREFVENITGEFTV